MRDTYMLDGINLLKLPEGNHRDGEGLLLQVRGESRSWILRYSIARKDRYLGLGSLREVSLKKARLAAGVKRGEIDSARKGERGAVDPVDDRKRVRQETKAARVKAKTFKQAALDYIEVNKTKWTNPKHAWQWGRTLELYVYPVCGGVAVGEVERSHVLSSLRPIWKKYPETARRTRGRIETVLAYAEANEWRDPGTNPAMHKPVSMALGDQDATVRKHPALPYVRMAELIAELRQQGGIAARAFEFQILTTTRGREATDALWSEIDWKEKTFTVPAARMKAKKKERRAHIVPLSASAVALLRRLEKVRTGPVIFGCTVAAVEKVIRTMNTKRMKAKLPLFVDPDQGDRPVVPHGVARASFRTWAFEKHPETPREIAEMCLAHTVGSDVERSYMRSDGLALRRALIGTWGAYCEHQESLRAAA